MLRQFFVVSLLCASQMAQAQDATARRIVALGKSDARVMTWLDVLANRFGGRLTGSDAYTHAATWTGSQLQQWGLQAALEEAGQMPLGFNRGPWSGRMLAPSLQQLRFATPAYTAGTKGVQRGLVAIGPATLAQAQARSAQFKGKWVLIGGDSGGDGRDGQGAPKPRAITLALIAAGALGTIQSADEPLFSGTGAPGTWETLPTLPDIKLAAPQFADIEKRTAAAEAVTLEFDIRNWFYPGPVAYHNVVAKIPGTAQPEEIVMLGAHLDSFDGGTGAADNGSSVATMMEVMRLLAASGARPRRSIVMVAFGGEELGRKGAFAYVARHPDQLGRIVMMLNRDAGPGAVSGITIPSSWKSVFARVEQDLQDAHPVFAFAPTFDDKPRDRRSAMSKRAGSDDAVFSWHGVPTPRIAAISDFDYPQALHTVLDTYDGVHPFRSAQQYSAIAIALMAYEIANAPEPISGQGYYRAEERAAPGNAAKAP